MQNTGDPSRIIVQVFDAWDEKKSGRGVVGMGTKKQLRIVEHAPWSVWPHLPPQSNGRSRGSDRPGYDPKRSFSIKVLDGSGQPLADELVEIKTEFVPFTGGHEHNNPALLQDKQGKFYGQSRSGNPLTGLVTDAEGKVEVDSLVASQVAGRYLVTASLKADSTVRDTVQLTVRVPELVDFSQINTHIWTLTGAIAGKHTDNHWCTQKMLDSLVSAVIDFYTWSISEENKGRSIVLAINDMSLKWGGIFDYEGSWNLDREHSLHRVGKSVDIENLVTERIVTISSKTGKDTSFTIAGVKWVESFVDFMENDMKNWEFIPEGQTSSDIFRRTRKYPHFEWKGN